MSCLKLWISSIYVFSLIWGSGCSKNSTVTTSSDKTQYPCLFDHLQKDAQMICKDESITALNNQLPQMLEFTASRGDPFENLRLTLRDINFNMRENYGKMIENTGKNVFPLLVATDSEPDLFGVGGVWKLYLKDGTMKRIVPVSPAFEMHKSLSHMILGLFSIVSPYFRNPHSINWQPALRVFQQRIQELRFLLKMRETGLSDEDNNHALQMANGIIAYIERVLQTNSVSHKEFHTFGTKMAPFIERSMIRAAEAHAEGSIPGLQQLKEELGEEEWRKLYVIIPTVWPVSLYNIRLQALEKLMSFDQIKGQVVLVEGATSEAAAKTTLGRIVSDRAVAQMVWGGLSETHMKDHLFSLSTRRDLLSTTAAKELSKQCKKQEKEPGKPKCPYAGRIGNPEAKDDKVATMLRS